MKPTKELLCLVYMTVGSIKEAKQIGRILVKQNLVACVNILENMTSIYKWKDDLDEDGEVSKTHDFFPINRYSKNDWEPLAPDSARSFGFFIDDIVPENWSGLYEAEITKLVF